MAATTTSELEQQQDVPRPSARKRKQRQAHPQPKQAAGARQQQEEAVLFIGFHSEELEIVRGRLPELLPPPPMMASAAAATPHDPSAVAGGGGDDGGGGLALPIVDVTSDMLSYTVAEVLACRQRSAGGAAAAAAAAAAVAVGRVVLLVGPTAEGLGAALNDELAEWGVVPALIAAYQRRHEGMPLRRLVASLRDAHARYYGLLQPVRVEPLQLEAGASDSGGGGVSSCDSGGGGSGAGAEVAAEAAAEAAAAGARADHLSVLEDVRVVLSAALDAGEVPSIHGHYRPDAGHLVVLDGLLGGGEVAELLAWMTAPQHDHARPPPGDKWEMACVDRTGDRLTWGLQEHMLAALRDDPPPPVVSLQTRLAALYPEYTLCHMAAEHVGGASADPDPDSGGADPDHDTATSLSSFVGNAVMAGDPCAWHVDADPATVPPHSPWVHNFGYYHNRELGRPLFVTALLYLNESWPEDYHAETLFLDPETQLGLFVRPVPGRVVLMEQDMPHRISAPSREAPGPRYSLVWKLVMVPREAAPGDGDCGGGGGGSGGVDGSTGGSGAPTAGSSAAEGQGGKRGPAYQSICRPEWGEPVRIGSACGRSGVRAFQRGGRKGV